MNAASIETTPSFDDRRIFPKPKSRWTRLAGQQEKTMSTVALTGFSDTRMAHQFHRLVRLDPKGGNKETFTLHSKHLTIGRSRNCDIHLDDPAVSARHLTVTVTNGRCSVADCDSRNGSYVNGMRLDGARGLVDGDDIVIGATTLRFATRQASPTATADSSKRKSGGASTRRLRLIWALSAIVSLLMVLGGVAARRHHDAGTKAPSTPALMELQPGTDQLLAPQNTPLAAETHRNEAVQPANPDEAALIQDALLAYREGDLTQASRQLEQAQVLGASNPTAQRAAHLLNDLQEIRQLSSQAREAQAHGQVERALGLWDRLLTRDQQLVGDRPSFMAELVALNIQSLFLSQTKSALKAGEPAKALEHCRNLLLVNPDHREAQLLMAQIQSTK